MQPEAWAREWRHPLIHRRPDERRIPAATRGFLVTFGLQRVVIFEWRSAFEVSFAPLEKELVPYNAVMQWGEFCDEKLDRAWSRYLVVGMEEFCNGHASICVHESNGTVVRLDCELDKDPECFVNSSVELYGKSLLLAQEWSGAVHVGGSLPLVGAFEALADELKRVDRRAFEEQDSFWPSLIESVLEDPVDDPLDLEITSDPARSKPRF